MRITLYQENGSLKGSIFAGIVRSLYLKHCSSFKGVVFYGKVLRYQNARFIDLFVTDSIHLLTQYLI